MDQNNIDEMALLKAFIDHKTLSYTEVQEKGLVPPLNKQDRRALFKNTIDKFKNWELIESIPESEPRAWIVKLDNATREYNKLLKDIEQKQITEKYSFAHLQEEVQYNSRKLRRITLFRVLAVTGFAVGTLHFVTGLSLMELLSGISHFFRSLVR